MKSQHLSFELLVDLAEDRLAARDEQLAREHLATCPTCQSEMLRIEHLSAQMRTFGDRPQPHTSSWLRALFRAALRATRPRRVINTALFDSRLSPSAYGLRSGTTIERQIFYEAEPFTIDLRIIPHSEQWTLIGQVMGPASGGAATLLGPDLSREAEISSLGEFALVAVPPSRCTLMLALASETLIMPDLEVGI